jgi:peptidoglycan-associated lipoprotein
MRATLISLAAATLLLAACGSDSEEIAELTGQGSGPPTLPAPSPPPQIAAVPTAPMPSGPMQGSPEDFVVNVGDRVFFDYDIYELKPSARTILEQQATWLQRYPTYTITVEGHADERGTREYNLALGERRANAVKNYLVALGISPDRVATLSYGKERPAVLGSNEAAWAQNRRGVSVLTGS